MMGLSIAHFDFDQLKNWKPNQINWNPILNQYWPNKKMYNYCVFLKLSTNVLAQFRNPVSTLNPIYLDFRLWEDFADHICHIINICNFLKWDSLFFLRREIWRLFFIWRTFPRSDSVSFPPFENSPNFFSFITGQSIPADVFFFNPLERQCCLRSFTEEISIWIQFFLFVLKL